MSDNQQQEIDLKELAEVQKTHLDFLEELGSRFKVSGVAIVQALNYELIQLFNNIAMAAMLGEDEHG